MLCQCVKHDTPRPCQGWRIRGRSGPIVCARRGCLCTKYFLCGGRCCARSSLRLILITSLFIFSRNTLDLNMSKSNYFCTSPFSACEHFCLICTLKGLITPWIPIRDCSSSSEMLGNSSLKLSLLLSQGYKLYHLSYTKIN